MRMESVVCKTPEGGVKLRIAGVVGILFETLSVPDAEKSPNIELSGAGVNDGKHAVRKISGKHAVIKSRGKHTEIERDKMRDTA